MRQVMNRHARYLNTIRGRTLHELRQARRQLARAEATLRIEVGFRREATKLRANLYAGFIARLERVLEAKG